MSYKEVLDYLFARLPMYQRVGSSAFKKDLTNTRKLCRFLGNPENTFRSIHIAGTNGKGSSSHMLASVLQAAGYKTGLYTSPHLKDFTERIRIDGRPISEEEVIDFAGRMKGAVEEIDPSFFELTVAMAFDHFARHKVDIAVIETGLGGRFDSTNVIRPLISLITNISFDHQDMLGNTLPEIAFEKAGIIKEGIPAVIGERHPESAPVFIKKADESNSTLYFAEDIFSVTRSGWKGELTEYACHDLKTGMQFKVKIDLPGDYQLKNLPGVLAVIDLLKIDDFQIGDKAIKDGLAQVRPRTGIRGRWEILSKEPFIVCDVGHNEDGIRWVTRQLEAMKRNRLHMVFGMVKDKKPDPVLKLLPKDGIYYFCQARIPRAKNSGELAEAAALYGLKGMTFPGVNEAVEAAIREYRHGDIIFIGGSTFVVAEINLLK